MLAVVDFDDPSASAGIKQVPVWFEKWEQALSRFRPNSELNALNRAVGQAFTASATLFGVVQQAIIAARTSGGIVTPAVLDALEAAGYDKSFEQLGESGSEESNVRARIGDWRACKLDAAHQTIKLPVGMRLDLGGIAKGWAADQAVKRLSEFGPALIDAGGDVAVSGPMADGTPWPIGIADPKSDDQNIAVVGLYGGAVATSGTDFRRWHAHGRTQHHLIDPRTGEPAETDVLTASVIAPTAVEAEMAAKLALIRGSLPGKRWLDEHPAFAGLLYLETGETIASARLDSYLYREPVVLA